MGRILSEQRAMLEETPLFIAAGAALDPRAPLPPARPRPAADRLLASPAGARRDIRVWGL